MTARLRSKWSYLTANRPTISHFPSPCLSLDLIVTVITISLPQSSVITVETRLHDIMTLN